MRDLGETTGSEKKLIYKHEDLPEFNPQTLHNKLQTNKRRQAWKPVCNPSDREVETGRSLGLVVG